MGSIKKHHTELRDTNEISEYVSFVKQIPVLSKEEELGLMEKFKNQNDKESGKKIILHHLKLVVSTAMKYTRYNNRLKDIISEGNAGLMEALVKFKPSKNVRFSTYAMFWITHRIQSFVINSWNIVTGENSKIKSLLFSKENKKELISSEISIDSENYIENFSINECTLEDIIKQEKITKAKEAMNSLSEIELFVIKQSYEESKTLKEMAIELKISQERVRQIRENALRKLRKNMEN